jgi:beta-glucosidase
MNTATNHRPWLDASLPVDDRVRLLLSKMTIGEKVAQMVQISYSLISGPDADEWAAKGAGSFLHTLGDDVRRLQRIATESRLGIPMIFGIDAIHGHAIHNGATVFPSQLALASSWDPDLAERVGTVTAREVAAEGLHWTFSPVLCLARDTRWGRVDETFGEDGYLAGKMGAGIIKGYQGKNPADKDRIVACAKHYVAYGESAGGRDSYDTPITMRKVRDAFLPPFAEAVKAGCLTFMAGYESIDGIPVSANKELLRDILRGELGFTGFTVTDWENIRSLKARQRVAANMADASRIAIEAGNDMIMTTPEFYAEALSLLGDDAGRGSAGRGSGDADGARDASTELLSLVDESVSRILSVKFRAGLFDEPAKVRTVPLADDPEFAERAKIIGCAEHGLESLEAARKSITLLKNDAVGSLPALPIRGPLAVREGVAGSEPPRAWIESRAAIPSIPSRKVRRIAVVGPVADSVKAQFGDWTFFTHPVPNPGAKPTFRVTTMLDGLRSAAEREGATVLHDKGCDLVDPTVESIARACRLAKKADIAFVCVGDSIDQNGECKDRADLSLTGRQNDLVRAFHAACSKRKIPLVGVLVNGKPLDFSVVAANCDAIVETFNPGTFGGEALADIVFGHREPEGRLPISFPRSTGQVPVHYDQLPGWHGGKYFDCAEGPLFAFGEGLSYSSFRYDSVTLSRERARAGETVDALVTLTNVGPRDATETVQVYARDRFASIVLPVLELKAFAKIRAKGGETVTAIIPLAVDSLSFVAADGRRTLEAGEFDIRAGHDSRDASLLTATLTVE